MGEKVYTSVGEVMSDCAMLAKNRYLQLIRALRMMQAEELILRGQASPQEPLGPGRKLVEYLMKAPVATTDFTYSVGFAAYHAVRCKAGWEARFCRILMNGQEKEILGRVLCAREEEAWVLCDLWFEFARTEDKVASHATIQGVPSECERFTEKDFMRQELARINFERFRQPYLFKLCLQLGLNTVVKPTDIRLLVAKKQDWIYICGKWPQYLPQKYHDYVPELAEAYARSKSEISFKALLRIKVYSYLTKYWHAAGCSCSTQQDLTSFINNRFGTSYKVESLARQCERLTLHSKRSRKPKPAMLSGWYLDEALRDLEHPQPDSSSASYFSA